MQINNNPTMHETIVSHPMFGEIIIKLHDDVIMFPAIQCAKILGYSNPRDVVLKQCKNAVIVMLPHPQNNSKEVKTKFIPEDDLYRLIMNSKLPEAERFQSWVYEEVLPSIRKTGGYVMPKREEKFFEEHYAFLTPETMEQVLKETRQYAKTLEVEKQALEEKTRVLALEATTWEPRDLITACIRRYASKQFIGETAFKMLNGWRAFYQRLYYEHGIGVNQRKHDHTGKYVGSKGSKINKLKDEELPAAMRTAVSLCEDYHVDINDLMIHAQPYQLAVAN